MTQLPSINQRPLRTLKTSAVEADCDLGRATLRLPAAYHFAGATNVARDTHSGEYTVSSKQSDRRPICPILIAGGGR